MNPSNPSVTSERARKGLKGLTLRIAGAGGASEMSLHRACDWKWDMNGTFETRKRQARHRVRTPSAIFGANKKAIR